MVTKTKTAKTIQDTVAEAAQNIGMAVMVTAAMTGLIEVPEQDKKPAIIIPAKPVFQFATENGSNNPMRREREETAPHFISYSEIQRTPGRAGKY